MESGDVVTCKSHEHKMTVRSVEGDKITVNYFVGSELKEETYLATELSAN